MINITSTFRLLDIFRSEPFLRLIPLNLSDHQKGIYALRCLFASWYILLQQQASEVVYFVEQLLQICFFTRFHSMTRKQRLCFLIFNPLTARQTSHHQQQRNMMSLVSERRKKKNPRTFECIYVCMSACVQYRLFLYHMLLFCYVSTTDYGILCGCFYTQSRTAHLIKYQTILKDGFIYCGFLFS